MILEILCIILKSNTIRQNFQKQIFHNSIFNKLEEYLNIFTGNILHNSRKQLRSIFSLCNHLKKKKRQIWVM